MVVTGGDWGSPSGNVYGLGWERRFSMDLRREKFIEKLLYFFSLFWDAGENWRGSFPPAVSRLLPGARQGERPGEGWAWCPLKLGWALGDPRLPTRAPPALALESFQIVLAG